MKFKKLGRTGLSVSVACLGTMIFGRNQVDEKIGIRMIETALDEGVNFIDTSDVYPAFEPIKGGAERIVAKALKGKRHGVILATKVGHDTAPDDEKDWQIGLNRKNILRGIENSLRRLETDYVDIYYAHLPDYNTPLDETLRAFDDLVHQGKVRYIACSNYRAFQLSKMLWISDLHKLARIECIQSPYNLLSRDLEYELTALCVEEQVSLIAYHPLASGLLSGKHDFSKPPSEGTRFAIEDHGGVDRDHFWNETNFKAVERLKAIASKRGVTLAQFALAWVLHREAVAAVTIGASKVEQLSENLKAMDIQLSDEELSACDDIWCMIQPPRFSYGK
jgi:aryl-alcohol dehydrogenase-like predicted oxidoreductase